MNPQEILGASVCIGAVVLFFLLLLGVQRAFVLNTFKRMQEEGLSDEEIEEAFREALIYQGRERF